MNSKLVNLLSMCRKSGRLVMGFDTAKESLSKGKAKVILLSSDISPKTEKEIKFFAAKTEIPVVKTDCTQDDFNYGIGKKVGVITICDEGFSKKALQLTAETVSDE